MCLVGSGIDKASYLEFSGGFYAIEPLQRLSRTLLLELDFFAFGFDSHFPTST